MIYFIHSAAGFVKIGYSAKVSKRLGDLQVANPHQLSLLGVAPGGMKTEQLVQSRFSHLWVRGEWFKADDELIQFAQRPNLARDVTRPVKRKPKVFEDELSFPSSGTEADARALLRATVLRERSLRKWAKFNGFSPSFVSQCIKGERDLSVRLLTALNIERVVETTYDYVKIPTRKDSSHGKTQD